MSDFPTEIHRRLDLLKGAGQYRELSLPSPISFVHNDYLNISRHPSILEAGQAALEKYGSGSKGSRLLGGHCAVFAEAESAIADFFGAPAALFFSSGYLANLAAVRTLAPLCDLTISDEKNHASLIDGVKLAGGPKLILPHQQWESVTSEMRRQKLLLISETLFSMDGDLVDYSKLESLFQSTESFLLLDEAHGAGVYGLNGEGVWRACGGKPDWRRTAMMIGFGKAFGVAGAAIVCSGEVRELLINQARSFIYTTAASPVVPAMVNRALEVVKQESGRRLELHRRAKRVRSILRNVDPALSNAASELALQSPIVPIFISGQDRALRFCENVRESGFDLRAIRYPTVPKGAERIRISLNLGASEENTEMMAREVGKLWKAFSSPEPIRA